jgi:hypothetical protein
MRKINITQMSLFFWKLHEFVWSTKKLHYIGRLRICLKSYNWYSRRDICYSHQVAQCRHRPTAQLTSQQPIKFLFNITQVNLRIATMKQDYMLCVSIAIPSPCYCIKISINCDTVSKCHIRVTHSSKGSCITLMWKVRIFQHKFQDFVLPNRKNTVHTIINQFR